MGLADQGADAFTTHKRSSEQFSQIARLLVERRSADREGVWMLLSPM